jgi:hypothetical protein
VRPTFRKAIPQGLKPKIFDHRFGTTEVVPCYKTNATADPSTSSAALLSVGMTEAKNIAAVI